MTYKVIVNFYIEKHLGWLQVFNWGFSWKNVKVHPLYFSERNGYTKYVKLGNWVFIKL